MKRNIDIKMNSIHGLSKSNHKRTVSFMTLGCKVNTYETQAMAELFKQNGYQIVDFEEKADVYVINTCTVTGLSDRKSRQFLRRARKSNPDAVIAAVGCYSQVSPESVSEIEGINVILGNANKNNIVKYVEMSSSEDKKIDVGNIGDISRFEDMNITGYFDQTRAYMKIQDGCNQFCSYCIIPFARGRIRSRAFQSILGEAERVAINGFKEVVLTGIHLTSYGMENESDIKKSLSDVIIALNSVQGIERIRLGSLEPLCINESFIRQISEAKKLCPHFHLSLQSGCDETLKRMNRDYTTDEYRKIVSLLRLSFDDVAITTDIMVGFPGETEQEFNRTLDFVNEISFASAHVFKYSPRQGTVASTMKEQVAPQTKEERSRILIELVNTHKRSFLEKQLNKVVEVLIEQEVDDKPNHIQGLTNNYISVICKGDKALMNKFVSVRITDVCGECLYGEILV